MPWNFLFQSVACAALMIGVYWSPGRAEHFTGQVIAVSANQLILEVKTTSIAKQGSNWTLVSFVGHPDILGSVQPSDEAGVWAVHRGERWVVREVQAHTRPAALPLMEVSAASLEPTRPVF